MNASQRCVHVIVRGRVQGVYYRAWTQQEATARGLNGWVRNRADGSVEAVLEGPSESVEAMLEAMHAGPPDARVGDIEIIAEGGSAPDGFTVRPTQ